MQENSTRFERRVNFGEHGFGLHQVIRRRGHFLQADASRHFLLVSE